MKSATLLLVVGLSWGCAGGRAQVKNAERAGEMLRVELAETYVEKGAYEAAIPLLRRAVVDLPNSPVVHALYGVVLRERGLYLQAEREFLLAVRVAPSYGAAHAGLGILYDLMRRHDDAERAHRRALALEPGNAEHWNNLGFSLLVRGESAEAIPMLERALGLDPSLVVALNNLGFAYGQGKDYVQAERCFRTAGGEASAYANLALVYEKNGEVDRAAELRVKMEVKQ